VQSGSYIERGDEESGMKLIEMSMGVGTGLGARGLGIYT